MPDNTNRDDPCCNQTLVIQEGSSVLNDAVCLVTGAASGIGRAIACAMAREGARVVVSDLAHAEGAHETVALIRDQGGDACMIAADVRSEQDCQALVAHTLSRYGRLDAACNNAGIAGLLAPLADYPSAEWQRVLEVNLHGVFWGMKHQIPALLANGGGAIVNIASILGAVGFAGTAAYCAAKHGVVGLTQVAALDYAARGLRCNSVGPAFIHTPMIAPFEADADTRHATEALHPIGRIGRPEEVAELVVWLCSTRASFVNGAYIPVDGAYLAR
jgi:NAD(P)-dependent dehydrogenase (short-subunit alcohol dehydrogenase family)